MEVDLDDEECERQPYDDHQEGRRHGDALSLDIEGESSSVQKPALSSSSWRAAAASFRESLSRSLSLNQQHADRENDDEAELKWAAYEWLPTLDRLHTSLC
ncbi:hypothetical protein PVAP13_8NG045540 [Panicum virgatum]|uniref:Uncharacterized protein n=1 Tax=Panicum virgatum TaxID=38727 RepID=A0A8T0PA04_PANVG|nr:hypothetical protein PVAP13_8NG045540 [Panicum virgatum]